MASDDRDGIYVLAWFTIVMGLFCGIWGVIMWAIIKLVNHYT